MAMVHAGRPPEPKRGALEALRGWASRMWRGEEPLGVAFWQWAVSVGLIVNVAFVFAMYGAISAGAPGIVLVLVHLAPWPYNIFTGIAVWRAADRYPGSPFWATAARSAIILWTIFECAV